MNLYLPREPPVFFFFCKIAGLVYEANCDVEQHFYYDSQSAALYAVRHVIVHYFSMRLWWEKFNNKYKFISFSILEDCNSNRKHNKGINLSPLKRVIKEDLYNKHNAHNTAAAKIFLKNFFVNTKTSEMPIIVSSAPKLK